MVSIEIPSEHELCMPQHASCWSVALGGVREGGGDMGATCLETADHYPSLPNRHLQDGGFVLSSAFLGISSLVTGKAA